MDPAKGRFATRDTEEGDDDSPSSLHGYKFADASPLNGLDPSGNDTLVDVGVTLGTATIIATLSFTTYCATQFAVSTALANSGIDTSTAVGPCVNRGGLARMRAQVQWGTARGRGGPTFGRQMTAPAATGVTVTQAIGQLSGALQDATPFLPSQSLPSATAAVEVIIAQISRLPAMGGIQAPSRPFKKYFDYRGYPDARVELENQQGRNLRFP
jgi:hypothetical protein